MTTIVDIIKERGGIDAAQGELEIVKRNLDIDVFPTTLTALPERKHTPESSLWSDVVEEKLKDELAAQIPDPFELIFDFPQKQVVAYIKLEDFGIIKVDIPQRRLFSSSGYIFLLWMIGVSTVLLVVAILFMRGQIRPIRKLAIAAERFGKGREVPDFKPEGAREVRRAAEAFLDMKRRIQRQMTQRTDMLTGISHDLRTPLTRLKLELEMLGGSHDVGAMKEDIAEMEKMIAAYLDFVRGDGEEGYEHINLMALIQKLVEDAKRQNIEVTIDIEPSIGLRVRPMAFKRSLNNLVVNAGKYADHVWISAAIEDKKLQIQIEDNGPGIPEEMYEEVFKPFVRVDTARGRETGGTGLGLPITMDIIHSHGGSVRLSKSEHGGLSVKLRMPL